MNWSEFLNRDVDNENEDDLATMLVPDNFYIVGKRLVKFEYLIPNVKVVVCKLARLTPETFMNRFGMSMNHQTSLDEKGEAKKGEKRHWPGEIVKDIREIKKGEKVNV